jgi:hypothetical protein
MTVVDPQPFHPSRCRTAVLDKIRHWKAEKRLGEIRSEIGAGKLTWTEILETANARKP